MRLNLVPMLSDRNEGLPDGLADRLFERISSDESLGKVFDDFEVSESVRVPSLRELSRMSGKGWMEKIEESFPTFFGKIPYGDQSLTARYTTRFMEECASKKKYGDLDGRTLIITDVPLSLYHIMSVDVYPSRTGHLVSENVALASYALFEGSDNLDTEGFYKTSKHELGHTFGMEHCIKEPCVMNRTLDLDKRPSSFCAEHKKMLEAYS
jgi:predicted Zn-dependent protease